MRIRLPTIKEVLERWWQVRPLLVRATAYTKGAFVPEDVAKDIINGDSGIWFVEDEYEDLVAIVVAGVKPLPRGAKAIHVQWIGGKRLVEWWELLVDEMDRFARASGAGMISAYGRPGWVRFWKQRGVMQQVASEMMIRVVPGGIACPAA